MIMDKLTEFADSESVAAAAGTINVGNVVDIGEVQRDVGAGQPIYLNILCAADILTGGVAGTIQFHVSSDAQDPPAVDGSQTIHAETGTFVTDDVAGAELKAGDVIFSVALPIDGAAPYERYLGVQATIGGQTVTAGAVDAFLTLDQTRHKLYQEGQR